MATAADRLLVARPPETDAFTYLSLVELNLSKEVLPTLEDILRDGKLTAEIGWDLIGLLLPLLPQSRGCLDLVAQLGNPREVILKITERLRLLKDAVQEGEEEETATTNGSSGSVHPAFRDCDSGNSIQQIQSRPLQVEQCQTLIALLPTVHRRIKTQFPSRFLSTSLSAVLAAIVRVNSHHCLLIDAALELAQSCAGLGTSNGTTLTRASLHGAADPEAYEGERSAEDSKIQQRLLESFVTHLVEILASGTQSEDDNPGLGLSKGVFERLEPGKIVPKRPTSAGQTTNEHHDFQQRKDTSQKLRALADVLGLGVEALETVVKIPAAQDDADSPDDDHADEEGDEPPDSPEAISLSRIGSLVLLSQGVAEETANSQALGQRQSIFPFHAKLLKVLVGLDEAGGITSAGTEPDMLIDSLLALGLGALEKNQIGEPEEDDDFTRYLQLTSLISANCRSSTLRYYAHYLTSTVLRSNPSDVARLAFIRDTLENCPYENLKTSAISWIKGETLEANPPGGATQERSIFATPVALQTLSSSLFPDLTEVLASPNVLERWTLFQTNLSFYLATLNFYYLLLCARHLHQRLAIKSLHNDNDIGGSYLGPLREASVQFAKSLHDGVLRGTEGDKGVEAGRLDLMVLEDVLQRVERGVAALAGER
ncbi:MAG: hypothetical protein M1828_006037 [Chrysothrix sp. TS-e1954]|nr:MAG: hypothetical protein M1828_006037 [Chrysothrix sp. TS-e1954]